MPLSKRKNNVFLNIVFLLLWHIGSLSCGPSLDGELVTGEAPKEQDPSLDPLVVNAPTEDEERVEVPVEIYLDRGPGLGLVDVTAAVSYEVMLDGCASGYTETSTTTIAPYKFDVGCYVKLNQFVYDGTDNFLYNQTGSTDPFTDTAAGYAIGQDAYFLTADGGATTDKTVLRVYVENQVTAAAIAPGDAVVFRFSHIDRANDETILKSNIDQNGTTVTVTSVAPPSFQIDSVDLVNITGAGAGEFEFVFECTAEITGAGDDRICEEVDIFDNLRIMLVEDTFDSDPTVIELETAFGTDAGDGSPVATGDIHNAATTTTNGGFKSPNTGESNVLTGPSQMHLNPDMIVILRSEDPTTAGQYSWQYFNFDVNTSG